MKLKGILDFSLATLRDTLLPKLLSVAEMQDSRGGTKNAEGEQ
jgi:hypothetical protein